MNIKFMAILFLAFCVLISGIAINAKIHQAPNIEYREVKVPVMTEKVITIEKPIITEKVVTVEIPVKIDKLDQPASKCQTVQFNNCKYNPEIENALDRYWDYRHCMDRQEKQVCN